MALHDQRHEGDTLLRPGAVSHMASSRPVHRVDSLQLVLNDKSGSSVSPRMQYAVDGIGVL